MSGGGATVFGVVELPQFRKTTDVVGSRIAAYAFGMNTTGVAQLELDGVTNGAEAHANDSPSRNVSPRVAKKSPRAPVSDDRAVALETLLTFAEAAQLLGISLRQFRRLVDAGKITFVKVSERSPRVRPSELQRYLAASAIKYSEEQL